jgi:ABC-type transporter Mla subunit MlaD
VKRAVLPNGKHLEFPDGTSDRVIQRTVRKELGISDTDVLSEALSEMGGRLSGSMEQHAELLRGLSESLKNAATGSTDKVDSSIKAMSASQAKLAADLAKVASEQNKMAMTLRLSIETLNKTLDAALGQALEALDRSMQTARDMADSQKSSVSRLEQLQQQASATAKLILASQNVRRVIHITRDGRGDYTLESETRSLN